MNSTAFDSDLQRARLWFASLEWKPQDFQLDAWNSYLNGNHLLINAPTGSGKTFAALIGPLLEALREKNLGQNARGIQIIWISPVKALAREIEISVVKALKGMSLDWQVAVRTGDTQPKKRKEQLVKPPHILITTPESLHLMMAGKGYPALFETLKCIVVDEWHELFGSKRGVMVELALSRCKTIALQPRITGISATIGNIQEAAQVLFGVDTQWKYIQSAVVKNIIIESILPDSLQNLPWAGHLGIRMLPKVIPIIMAHKSTLIFTNTRSQTEIWYQKLLDAVPDLAGQIAMHHGSMSREIRDWVEQALYDGQLKAVVCTSSLDLGVDFRPVEAVIQIGSPKGTARFIQRAGRSGHQPGNGSKIYFLPTHSLELVEASALRKAIKNRYVERRIPHIRSFDVLLQYLVTLAVSDGFDETQLLREIRTTFSFQTITNDEWNWLLAFVSTGGSSLKAYDEFNKVSRNSEGKWVVENQKIARRHRMSIGVIVSESSMFVKFIRGKRLGTVEEYFVSKLNPGDVFWFAGQALEFVRLKDMMVLVRKSTKKTGIIPSWGGGRMPLSAQLAEMLRLQLHAISQSRYENETQFLKPLFKRQREGSIVPGKHDFLIESFETDDGHHLLFYPFEGRFVHEGMAALVAYRISTIMPISFSIAMNDYGFELLSDKQTPHEILSNGSLFSTVNLQTDISKSVNSTEMARRRFRDIASISGLVFRGFPGNVLKEKHLQSSSQLFFNVFADYDPNNLLLNQSFEEVLTFQLEEQRLRQALNRISSSKIIVTQPLKPTPLAFPIMVDRMREKLSSESLEERIAKMQVQFR